MPPRRPAASAASGRSQLLLGSHNTATDVPSAPCHEDSLDAGVIDDFGDSRQLEFVSQRSEGLFENHGGEILVAGAGHTFRDDDWARLDPSAPPSQLDLDDETRAYDDHPPIDHDFHRQVKADIHDAMVDSRWYDDANKEFLPFDELCSRVTKETIEKELILNGVSHAEVRQIRARIGPSASNNEKTTRRKLFAILIMIDKVPTILDLIEEGIRDSDLPLRWNNKKGKKKKHSLWRKSADDGSLVEVIAFQKWERHERESFHNNQWKVMAPFFALSSPLAPKVHHYPLDPNIILPFIADKGASGAEGPDGEEFMDMDELYEGGCSEVRRVLIHPHHHNLYDSGSDKNPSFAVKVLKEGTTKGSFEQEAHCLKRLMEQKHPSLVRLLCTFERKKRYHLIFPWADANLQHFWEQEFPCPNTPPRDVFMIRWMAREFLGLAGGLKLVHESPIRKDNAQEMPAVSQKIYGRHGDIKTTNILWFRGDDAGGEGASMGSLQIADFGFAAFHSKHSMDVPAQSVGRSPTHRAPECDGSASVSPSSDFWSLGAVLLEFVVWYVSGWQGCENFNQRRLEDDLSDPREDKYFSFHQLTKAVEVKASVRNEFKSLRSHDRCSAFLVKILDIIESKLLVVSAQERASCEELVEAFGRLHQRCNISPDFCISKLNGGLSPPPTSCLDFARQSTCGDSCISLVSDSSKMTKSALGSDESFDTQPPTFTRETTFEETAKREERRSWYVSGHTRQPRDHETHGLSLAKETPATVMTAKQEGGDWPSRQNSGSLSRRNSGRPTRQSSGRLDGQRASDWCDKQAGNPVAAPAPRWKLRKRDSSQLSSAAGTMEAGRCSLEARLPPNSRKRTISDDSVCPGTKVQRRSTA